MRFLILSILSIISFTYCVKNVKPEAIEDIVPPEKEERVTLTFQEQKQKTQEVDSASNQEVDSSSQNTKTKLKISSPEYGRSSTSHVTLYTEVLSNFFRNNPTVPYALKLQFEEHIADIRSKITNDKHILIHLVAFYPKHNMKEKRLSVRRVKQLLDYSKWKEKLPNKHFKSLLQPTDDKSKFRTMKFFITIPKSDVDEEKDEVHDIYREASGTEETNSVDKEEINNTTDKEEAVEPTVKELSQQDIDEDWQIVQ